MLGQIKRVMRRFLIVLGIFPYAKRVVEWGRSLPHWHKNTFKLRIDGAVVSFVTRDPHSKVWCHRRHEGRQEDLHEPAIVKEFAHRIRNAYVFADVGGHLGYYSCIAGVLNPHLKIFCFEMNRRLVPVIEANFRENQLRNAVVVPSPVADKKKVVSYEQISVSGNQSMHTEDGRQMKKRRRAYTETITLDDFFCSRGIVPDIIKIDIEGAEMDALRGAITLIQTHRPLLFLELHPKEVVVFRSSVREVLDYLEFYGYFFYKTDYLRLDGKIEHVDRDSLLSLKKSDMVICVPEGQPRPGSSLASSLPAGAAQDRVRA